MNKIVAGLGMLSVAALMSSDEKHISLATEATYLLKKRIAKINSLLIGGDCERALTSYGIAVSLWATAKSNIDSIEGDVPTELTKLPGIEGFKDRIKDCFIKKYQRPLPDWVKEYAERLPSF